MGIVDNNWTSRDRVPEGLRNFLTKSTPDVTARHSESLVDIPSSECIPKTVSSKVNSGIRGGISVNHRAGGPKTPLRGFRSLSVSTCTPQSKPLGVSSDHPSSNPPTLGATKSIIDLLLLMGSNKSGRSILKTVDLSSFKHKVVKFFLVDYNGNCIFELPPFRSC